MGNKSKDFPLFRDAADAAGYRNSQFTDDTVMTIAVADGMKKAAIEKTVTANPSGEMVDILNGRVRP